MRSQLADLLVNIQNRYRSGGRDLSLEEREQLRELVSVLTSIPFDAVDGFTQLAGAKFGLIFKRVEEHTVQVYQLILWQTGDVELMDPATNMISLDLQV
jgi:predicted GTPase